MALYAIGCMSIVACQRRIEINNNCGYYDELRADWVVVQLL